MTMYRICLRYLLLLIIAVIRVERRKAFCQAPGRRQNYESSNSEHGRKKSGFLGPKLSKKEHYFRPEKKLKDTNVGGSFFVLLRNLREGPNINCCNNWFTIVADAVRFCQRRIRRFNVENKTSKCLPLYMALCSVVLIPSGCKWSSCTPNLLDV